MVKTNKGKETKSELFNRLGKQRIEKVLKSIRILGNCSNRNTYEYSQQQISKMTSTLVQALEQMLNKFTQNKKEIESFEF